MKAFIILVLTVAVVVAAVMFYRPEHAFQKAHTIREYQTVVDKFPSSAAATRARGKVEQLRFEKAVQEGTPTALLDFEGDYPTSRYLSQLPRTPLGYAWPAEALYHVILRPRTRRKLVAFSTNAWDWVDDTGQVITPPEKEVTRLRYPPLDRYYLVIPFQGGTGTIDLSPRDWAVLDDQDQEYPISGVLVKGLLIPTDAVSLPRERPPVVRLVFEVPAGLKTARLKVRGHKPIEIKADFLAKNAGAAASRRHLYRGEWFDKEELLRRGLLEIDGELVVPDAIRLAGSDLIDGRVVPVADLLRDGWIYKGGRWLEPQEARRAFPAEYLGRWCTKDFARAAGGDVLIDGEWTRLRQVLSTAKPKEARQLVNVTIRRGRNRPVEALLLGRESINYAFGFLRPGGRVVKWLVPHSMVVSMAPAGRLVLEKYARTTQSLQPEELMELGAWWRTPGRDWPHWDVYERMCRLRAGKLLLELLKWHRPVYATPAADYTEAARRMAADKAVFLSDPFALTWRPEELEGTPWDGFRILPGTTEGRLNPGANLDYVIATYGVPQDHKRRCVPDHGLLDYYRYDRLWFAVNEWNDIVLADVGTIPFVIKLDASRPGELTADRPFLRFGGEVGRLVFSSSESALAFGAAGQGVSVAGLSGDGLRPSGGGEALEDVALDREGRRLLGVGRSARIFWPSGTYTRRNAVYTRVEEMQLDLPDDKVTATVGAFVGRTNQVVIGTSLGGLYVFEQTAGAKPVLAVPGREKAPVSAITASSDGHYAAFVANGMIGVVELDFPHTKFFFRGSGLTIRDLSFSYDNRLLLIAGNEGTAALDVEDRRLIMGPSLPPGLGLPQSLTVLPDLNYVAVFFSQKGGVNVVTSERDLLEYRRFGGVDLRSVKLWRVSPDANWIACGGGGGGYLLKLTPRFKIHTPSLKKADQAPHP